jgi:aubergine-like protein
MIVVIDVCQNSFTAKQSVLGFWASLNASCTKGYSKAVFHGVNQEISDILTPVFNESINKFIEVNSGHKPECIVVYRDGVGKSQYEKVVNFEIPQVVAAIKEIDSQWNPQIVVMGVNKRVNQRFFLNGRNPGHGLVVNEGVVLDNANFYLISHFSTIGCITPTHYHVVVNESNIDEQILYQLTYDLCYLYFNWQGGIRVPAPCMYAHKIAYLVGKHTGVLVDSDLLQSFFFL